MVLYEGTRIVAAIHIDLLDSKYGAIRFLGIKNGVGNEKRIAHLLKTIEKWLARKGINFLTSVVNEQDIHFLMKMALCYYLTISKAK